MMNRTKLLPRTLIPHLEVRTTEGSLWRVQDQPPGQFSFIAFYRGLHSQSCGEYLRLLEQNYAVFLKLGVRGIAISMDAQERARAAKQSWGLDTLPAGYGLTAETALYWGLYLSSGHDPGMESFEEEKLFCEPGFFLVNNEGYGLVYTFPFARPDVDDVLGGIAGRLKE